MIDPSLIIPGAVAGYINDTVQDKIHQIMGDTDESVTDLLKKLIVINEKILEQTSQEDNPDIIEVVALVANNPDSYIVPTWKRNHLILFNGTAGYNFFYKIPGMQQGSISLGQHWYVLDFPSGTQMWTDTNVNVLIKWSDTATGQFL